MIPNSAGFLSILIVLFALLTECTLVNVDIYLTTPQIIRRHGYASESHTIQTDDGFLLTLHRIPRSKNGTLGKQPVFLQHGLFASSVCFVALANNSLAFILSDLGYDVWLGNARGNEYSQAHSRLSPSDAKFWNFSWHEMALFDVPAALTYIANETKRPGEIIYVGHSMGTTMFFAFATLLPDVARKVSAMIALAPVALMTNVTSPIHLLAPWVDDIAFITKHLGINEFLPSNKIIDFLAFHCATSFTRKICENLLFLVAGFDKSEMDEDVLDVVLGHATSGTSTKTVLHYLQEIANRGKFQYYDYGEKGNILAYGQPTPPLYAIYDIKVPIYLMYADDDMLANPSDVKTLYSALSSPIGIYEVPMKTFNHVDFIFARDASQFVYKQLLQVIQRW